MITFRLSTVSRRLWRAFSAVFGIVRLHGVTVTIKPSLVPELLRENLLFKRYEKQEIYLVKKYINRGDKVLEIGAGMGLVGIVAAKKSGDTGIVVCEPNPGVVPIIRKNYALNRLAPTLVNKAVTADGRDIDFLQDCNILGSSMFGAQNPPDGFTKKRVESVPVNSLIGKYAPTVLLIDAEGAEVEILEVADLAAVKTIIVETHRQIVGDQATDSMIEHLRKNGFDIREQARDTLCLQRA